MIVFKDGTRDLLPPIEADPGEMVGAEALFAGSLAPAAELPLADIAPVSMQPAADPPPIEQVDIPHDLGFAKLPAAVPVMGPAASSIDSSEVSDPGRVIPVSSVEVVSVPKHSFADGDGGAGGREHIQGGGGETQPRPQGDGTLDGGNRLPVDAGDMANEVDNAHSISVTQIAIVDQEASVMVSGYVGEVVARVHIDQDLMMDQDVDVSVLIDGDGHFNLLLDQYMRIEQEVEVDIDIFDVDGVLYVDIFLRDSIEIEQDTTLDMRISDGSPGGAVEVNQDIELDQKVDIDIDVEDELEERYAVKVNVVSLQEVDAQQDAAVDIANWNGEIDMDVNAVQTAFVEQHTFVQADFSLV
jgi:hypothetical protein